MANSSSVIHVNVNSKVKNDASEILNGLGLNMSTAINIFLAQVVKRKGIPFEVKEPTTKEDLALVLEEMNQIINDEKNQD
ncbi:MAG TPA: type II toxin-antitoxin system RelB/DinJ family antitoxin [Candidatus Pelethosoma merdigallinarum]|nr:type II toxin-antitoxin system RelB/DinJ family antitoxin [Candidatus Pelethosoma merdigallinarum]